VSFACLRGAVGDFAIAPFIGFDSVRVNSFLKSHLNISPPICFSENLGFLMPQKEYRKWDFFFDMPNDSQLEDIKHSISKFGFDFLREHADLHKILELVDGYEGKAYEIIGCLDIIPIALLCVLGEIERARAIAKHNLVISKQEKRSSHNIDEVNLALCKSILNS
ncbi:MAG: hypothetical protein KIS92_18815, partial [Planctomycetota bacterium]|nr:hypothetical protein [Planctomycetota bacterium]